MHSRRPDSKPSGPWVSLTGASKQAGVTRRSGIDATPMRSIAALLPTGQLSVSCARALNFDYFLESCSADWHRCRKLESHTYPNRCKLLLPRGMAPTSDAPATRTHCIDSYTVREFLAGGVAFRRHRAFALCAVMERVDSDKTNDTPMPLKISTLLASILSKPMAGQFSRRCACALKGWDRP